MVWTRQLSDLLKAGLPFLTAVDMTRQSLDTSGLREVITTIHNSVQDGAMFSTSLARHPQVFPPVYVQMVRAAETGGYLSDGLVRLATLLEKEEEARQSFRHSLIYPLFILALGLVAVSVLLIVVVPRVAEIYEEFGQRLPGATLFLLNLNEFVRRWGWLVALMVAMTFVAVKKVAQRPAARGKMDKILLQLPLVGNWLKESFLATFSRALATLLTNGVVVKSALDASQSIVTNRFIQQKLGSVCADVVNGASLCAALKKNGILSGIVYQIVVAAEAGGEVQEGLFRLADYLDAKIANRHKRMMGLVEPLFVLTIGCVIGFFVFALMLPVFRINLLVR